MAEHSCRDAPGRRAAAYWFIDGLPEIVAGLGFVLFGAGAIWFDHIQPHSWFVRAVFLAIEFVALAVIFFYGRSISLYLKARITFPRTGYVRPPSDWEAVSQRETVISLGLEGPQALPDQNITHFRSSTLGVVVGGNVIAGVIGEPIGLPIAMCVVAALFYALHRESERPYYWASVLPLPVAGLGAMLLHMGRDANAWTAVVIGGVWLAAQGGWKLICYMRSHPRHVPAETARS
jgi:hypothetical protein